MYRWQSTELMDAIGHIPFVTDVENAGPGGDYDTDCLVVSVFDSDDKLYVHGFCVDNEIKTPSNVDVEYIALSDGKDSRGGLWSQDYNIATVYVDIRQMFVSAGVSVVPTMDEFF